MDDYQLYSNVEQLAVDLISKRRTIYKGVCANVDFYSGFVYSMLGIPEELFTPLFCNGTYCRLECTPHGRADHWR